MGGKSDALHFKEAIKIGRMAKNEDLDLACQLLIRLPNELKELCLQMAILAALADRRLVTTENHVLRFLADVLGLFENGLDRIFKEMTGHDFPTPGDASKRTWWNERTRSNSQNDSHKTSSRPQGELERLKCLAILGLHESASLAEIQMAYRRLASVHHPDRFSQLGEAAVQAATISFKRINAAYQHLVAS